MDRTEFIVATAILLFGAFCLGFLTHWVTNRLSHVSKADLDELDEMAEALHDAEEARDEAQAELKAEEEKIHTQLAETEASLKAKLAEAEAELRAAMDGLQSARRETEELREFISKQNMGSA